MEARTNKVIIQNELEQQYLSLSNEQKGKFLDAQKRAMEKLSEYIQGKIEISNLSQKEFFVLQKIKKSYEDFKKNNPKKHFAFDFGQKKDRDIYDILIQKIAIKIVASNEKTKISQQTEKSSDLKDEDFKKFKVKQGETDIGVFWYEYGNIASKKLKESGEFEWGKERIYFDIPLNNMEELRDLSFEIAKSEKIPIAFKHLDIQKTDEIDLKPTSKTTRFVANFASIKDAKRFYQVLQQQEKYKNMKSDRNINYHGYNIDGVAHYASGLRERREPLKRIMMTAKKNNDGSYSYYSADGLRKITITEKQYINFMNQFNAMPDPKEAWEKTII